MYRELRQSLGLSQIEFGRLLGFGTPQVRVSELENGKNPGSPQLQNFCKFLQHIIDEGNELLILEWFEGINEQLFKSPTTRPTNPTLRHKD